MFTEFELYRCSPLQLEEEEAKDSFDVDVAVTNPEKIGQSLFYLYFLKTMI